MRYMKVSIGSKIVDGPWGGGNLFVANISNYLLKSGHKVIYNLSDSDIDLILLTDPRSRKESTSTFNHIEIQKYKKYVNENVLVVQRINECDERKGTDYINNFYLNVSNIANHVVFVSSWLRNIYLNLGLNKSKTSVILAGANPSIFNSQNQSEWKVGEKIKIVTHHWSSHENKGFKIYRLLDSLIETEKWKDKIEFTYIGNLSQETNLKNTKIVPPLDGLKLANEIKKHHIYLTASINEPSGNHHIEGAQCGLPILYLESGGIPEYCDGYGVSFKDNFETQLEKIIDNYDFYKKNMKLYSQSSEKMCKDFYDLFENLLKNKIKTNNKKNFLSILFLFKHKFYRNIRDGFYFEIKTIFIRKVKVKFKKNG